MANQEHLDILKQGVKAWNEWRKQYREVKPDISKADLSGADLGKVDFRYANLKEADLGAAHLNLANLYRANLCDANLQSATLVMANLNQAKLRQTFLLWANLVEAKLNGADLARAVIRYANLGYAQLNGANFSGADLNGANLGGTNCSKANFTDATIGWTIFGRNLLKEVKGLDTVKHDGPSSIGIDTIYASHGDIPETFLKGAGIDDTFITYIRSFVGKAIEYYSCFISYSSKDESFAKRLYADLQSHNVRCWFAPEDLKWESVSILVLMKQYAFTISSCSSSRSPL